ncbi:hypothetical protein FDUTEX481_08303 [Tolypothrix sp. PCC 7601]|nr:hypothetical protein FDUTEX481_08303 [Tolypothrix sp. PCC 7601]
MNFIRVYLRLIFSNLTHYFSLDTLLGHLVFPITNYPLPYYTKV